ncbi:MAG TPA: WYL domain-containing protein [Solirubrobacteraceae bacterium]|nr:WYL domain-containing protein [Solirubrobacteraceae bacterium]
MAKDTEKLIRQLSLISFLMAERRPVTAPEIRQAVEGYSGMNEDAFARRFYADRAELESLGIQLCVAKPLDGAAEQESYSLPPENFYLPAIEFTNSELAALQTALSLLDGEFAYAEPLRLALQQISWGRPSPLRAAEQRSIALGITASAGGHAISQRLVKIDTAISRRKTIVFDYYTMDRDETGERRVDPYQLLFQGGQFYMVGHSHERDDIRVFRLSRMRGKVAYATKAEHDFQRPADFDPRAYADRIPWQFGEARGEAEVLISDRIAWQVERHFGHYGRFEDTGDGRLFITPYANQRALLSWVLGLGEHARLVGPPELVQALGDRVARLEELHRGEPRLGPVLEPDAEGRLEAPEAAGAEDEPDGHEAAIRPERFARLVTLASILIEAGRAGQTPHVAEVCERLQISDQELRDDISVLNVVNFGAGSYILYAEVTPDGSIEVDPDAYSDSFARPARLLPIEAKALVAAIDLIGEHIPKGSLTSARDKIVTALGEDPVDEGLQVASSAGDDSEIAAVVSAAIAGRRLLGIEYYKENEDEFSQREVEPYALMNGREGWYVAAFDPSRDSVRHFRLDRIKRATVSDERFDPRPEIDPAADLDGWPRTGEVEASRRARVWVSADRARWAREERPVVAELADGSVVVELAFAGAGWLVREVLKEVGDAAVLEPAEAREAVRDAAARLGAAAVSA